MPIVISSEENKVSTFFETGEKMSPWGTIPPRSGGASVTHISGLKQWSIHGLGPDAESVQSAATIDRAVKLTEAGMVANPDSVIHRRENHQSWLSKLSVDASVRGGIPCVGNGQWPVAHILELLAEGFSPSRVLEAYPGMSRADVQLALNSASWVMRDPAIDWPALGLPDIVDFQHELRAWDALSDNGWPEADSLQGE